MFNWKKRMTLTNNHMATFFFMWFLLFMGLSTWQMVTTKFVNTMTVIMVFICIILSMSFKTWALIREVQTSLDILIERKVL